MCVAQTQWERPTGGGLNQPFVPAATFAGAQQGYYFSMGSKGLGYYKDEPKTGVLAFLASLYLVCLLKASDLPRLCFFQ